MKITFSLKDTEFTKKLEHVKTSITKAWNYVADYTTTRIKFGFAKSKDPANKSWEPLAASTLIARRRLGVSHTKQLLVTGKMRNSLTVARTSNSIYLTMQSPAPYHQYGTRHIPSRKIFPDQTNETAWARDIEDYLEDLIDIT